jgi:hypothetical protein
MFSPRPFLALSGLVLAAAAVVPAHGDQGKPYAGTPFHDSVYPGGPQQIPGRVFCAYYDFGGEGVAYHDSDAVNHGSGGLNPANGTYLNEFRMHEGVDTSYTKYHDHIDDNPFEALKPPEGLLYVGWTEPGEWFRMTVGVAKAGRYAIDLLYTSNRGGALALDLDGEPLAPAIPIVSTKNPAETIPWRQWHHWNLARSIATVSLPAGVSVLTLHIVEGGNMNLAYLDFRAAD